MTDEQHAKLVSFLHRIRTGPLGLRDAIIAALAFTHGVVPYVCQTHVIVLQEHAEGWFGLRLEVESLLAAIHYRQQQERART